MKEKKNLSYLIIGAGGIGGTLGAYMAAAGKDVTLIARGEHLRAMQERGLRVERPTDPFVVDPVKAYDMESYEGCPDVIFVCVKGYSLESVIPFIRRVAGKTTIVVPILNIYGTGGELQKELPEVLVTDGCIYVAAQIQKPGTILMKGDILRVVFGVREKTQYTPRLERIRDDLTDSGIHGILSENIQRDALLKFSYVSAQGACGLYYNVPAGDMQKPGKIRDCFAELVHEIDLLAQHMGIRFEEDIVERNLKILDALDPTMTTSMQRDIEAGKQSEIDGLIYSVVRLGEEYGASLPEYKKISIAMRERESKKRVPDPVIFMNMCMLCDGDKVLALDKIGKSYSGTTFPGGHVEPGETFAHAMIREMQEETGLTIEHPVLKGIYHWHEDGVHSVGLLYRAEHFTGELKSSEEGRVYWIPLDEYRKKETLAEGMSNVLKIMEQDTFTECYMEEKEDESYEEHLF